MLELAKRRRRKTAPRRHKKEHAGRFGGLIRDIVTTARTQKFEEEPVQEPATPTELLHGMSRRRCSTVAFASQLQIVRCRLSCLCTYAPLHLCRLRTNSISHAPRPLVPESPLDADPFADADAPATPAVDADTADAES
jgi:hypothetical protein